MVDVHTLAEGTQDYRMTAEMVRRYQYLITGLGIATIWIGKLLGMVLMHATSDVSSSSYALSFAWLGILTVVGVIIAWRVAGGLRKCTVRVTPSAIVLSGDGKHWREFTFGNDFVARMSVDDAGSTQRIVVTDATSAKTISIRGYESMDEIRDRLIAAGVRCNNAVRQKSPSDRLAWRTAFVGVSLVLPALVLTVILWYKVNLTSGCLVLFVVASGWATTHHWRSRDLGGRLDAYIAAVWTLLFVSLAIIAMLWLHSIGIDVP